MKVNGKDLGARIEVKNTGMELAVSEPNGTHLGDLVVTKTRLIWCQGKTKRENGTEVSWQDFIEFMQSR